MRLHAGAETRQEPGQKAQPVTPSDISRARQEMRAADQEETEEEVSLTHAASSLHQVIGAEEERGEYCAPSADRAAESVQGQRRQPEPYQVKQAPAEVAASEYMQLDHVDEVGSRQVHVEDVPVGHGSRRDPPGDVIHDRSVVYPRPA
jgi:hypothetical protein